MTETPTETPRELAAIAHLLAEEHGAEEAARIARDKMRPDDARAVVELLNERAAQTQRDAWNTFKRQCPSFVRELRPGDVLRDGAGCPIPDVVEA